MASNFTFEVQVSIERVQGKFATREELAEQVLGWLENCNEGTISGVGSDGDSEYEVQDFEVQEIEQQKRGRR